MTEEETKKETKKEEKEIYVSRQGFEVVPILRGFTEIENLYEFIEREEFRETIMICGGYVRYCCSPRKKPEPAGDVDLYISDPELFPVLVGKFKEVFGLEIKHENEVSISFEKPDDHTHPLFPAPPVQLIKPENKGKIIATGEISTILENFDFTVIRAGLLTSRKALVDADFIHDETHRLLRVKNIHCPVSSLLRCYKYARKGYFMRPMEALRLFVDWEQRDDEYRGKIIDFLTKADSGKGLSEEDINELEKLMRID